MAAMQSILWEEVPAIYPYFYQYLAGHDTRVSGVVATALGHTILSRAVKT